MFSDKKLRNSGIRKVKNLYGTAVFVLIFILIFEEKTHKEISPFRMAKVSYNYTRAKSLKRRQKEKKQMNIRRANENDIPRLIELLEQVLQVHADIRPDILSREPQNTQTKNLHR